ncbi:MAG: ATP-binding protein [Candidatus Thorarchaeota archaeon]|jgi:hypothetical protein
MMENKERLVSNEIKKLIPVLGKETASNLSRAYLLGDEDTRDRIFELIDAMKAAVFTNKDLKESVLMEPPNREIASDGDFEIGKVLYGKKTLYPLMFKKKDLLTHMGIFGSSGYGKTNISYSLIEKLSENNTPVLIFDFSKRNYRDLLSTKLKDKIDIFTVGRKAAPLRFNPLKPPKGVQLSQWMKEFATIFDHAYWLLGGGRHIIMKALDGVHETNESPRMDDLKSWLNEYGSSQLPARERNWLATAERPLESLCFKEIGEVFDCDKGVDPSDFFKEGRITILELDAMDVNDKSFFIEIMLQWIRDWLLVGDKREKLVGTIILEEAHHVLNRDKANKIGSETVIDLIFREVRELGIGMIYIDQHPSLVSYPALGNTSTHIYMNLGLDTKHSSDIQDASNMLGLDYVDEGNYLRKLPVGHGFMLSRMSDFHDPFLVEFPFVDLKKGAVRDEDIKRHMTGKIEIEKPKEYTPTKITPEDVKEGLIEEAKTDTQDPDTEVSFEDIDENGWKIIEVLGKAKGAFTSQIYKELGMSGTAFSRKAKNLMDMGLVGTKVAKVHKNKLCYHFLTETGESVFNNKFEVSQKEKETDLNDVIETFTAGGWKYDKEGKIFSFEENGKVSNIKVQITHERKGVYDALIKNTRQFICASEAIKNMVIQEGAKFSYKTGTPFALFVSTVKDFEKKGNFDKIEFERV